jgi:hypothetical protein
VQKPEYEPVKDTVCVTCACASGTIEKLKAVVFVALRPWNPGTAPMKACSFADGLEVDGVLTLLQAASTSNKLANREISSIFVFILSPFFCQCFAVLFWSAIMHIALVAKSMAHR